MVKEPATPGDTVLAIRGLTVADERGHLAVDDVDLEVRAGEVLGVAGVQGNGQTELVEAIMALRPVARGDVTLAGKSLAGRTTAQVLAAGIGYIPEDRSVDGLVREFTVAENLVLDVYHQRPYASGLALHHDAIAASADKLVARLRHPYAIVDGAGQYAVRRQPAEGDRGEGDVATVEGAGRGAADAWRGRRFDRSSSTVR